MLKITGVFLFLCISQIALAQVFVEKKDINLLTEIEYIELIIDRRGFNRGQVFAIIDYGQTIRWFELRRYRIQNEKGEDKLFGSEMDIFNFLYQNQWLHETTFSAGEHGYIFHIFRRKPLAEIK
ncbi:MAG: hypothetical protein H7Y04_10895 [Verrucomicrobia bacterium]|nr:hypothetical protein [Cytophagales bacterium]